MNADKGLLESTKDTKAHEGVRREERCETAGVPRLRGFGTGKEKAAQARHSRHRRLPFRTETSLHSSAPLSSWWPFVSFVDSKSLSSAFIYVHLRFHSFCGRNPEISGDRD